MNDYHLKRFGPCPPHWPRGGWSLYQINGDQIAQRVKFGPDGRATERHSWCGYLGIYETLPEVMAAIESGKTA